MRTLVVTPVVLVLASCGLMRSTAGAASASVASRPCLIDDECAEGATCERIELDAGGVERRCVMPQVAARAPTFAPAQTATPDMSSSIAPAPAMPLAPIARAKDGRCSTSLDCEHPEQCVDVEGGMGRVCAVVHGMAIDPTIKKCSFETDCPGIATCERLPNGSYGCVE